MKINVTRHGLFRWKERIDPTASIRNVKVAIRKSIIEDMAGEYVQVYNPELECKILLVRERKRRKRRGGRGKENGTVTAGKGRYVLVTAVRSKNKSFLRRNNGQEETDTEGC